MAPSWCRLLWLLSLLALSQVLIAVDFSTERRPQGRLGVRLDYSMIKNPNGKNDNNHRWLFSTHLKFGQSVDSLSKGKLRKILQDAFNEMDQDCRQYNPKTFPEGPRKGVPMKLPTVMTILAVDDEIILSSSQIGKGGFIDQVADSPVKAKLDLCQAFFKDRGMPDSDHYSRRGCGEVFTFHQYFRLHPDRTLDYFQGKNPKARVTTIKRVGGGDDGGTIKFELMEPCPKHVEGTDTEKVWGCNFMMAPIYDGQPSTSGEYIFDYFTDATAEDYDLDRDAGGVIEINQMRACDTAGDNNLITPDQPADP